ncbi:hypothetical protein [Mesorhizobium sp.]|uniref:hypothetical protein n=1 Tax=Mesorhizobium sp. TaxID=1871066 RepID=UPI00338EE95C
MQALVPPIPQFGKPAFLFQDKRRHARLLQRMGGGQHSPRRRRSRSHREKSIPGRFGYAILLLLLSCLYLSQPQRPCQ